MLLHPHPDHGGDRFHPFVDNMFSSLPSAGVDALRFDFSSADPEVARAEVLLAVERGRRATGGDERGVVLCGYSFGAAMSAGVIHPAIAGWYLLAPPVAMLRDAVIADDPRPKAIAVPAHDQYSSPEAIRDLAASWAATEVSIVESTDHFLAGAIARVVRDACRWVVGVG